MVGVFYKSVYIDNVLIPKGLSDCEKFVSDVYFCWYVEVQKLLHSMEWHIVQINPLRSSSVSCIANNFKKLAYLSWLRGEALV